MPLKINKKGGGTKSRSFQENVSDLKKKGYSDESAKKITGKIQAQQEGGKMKPGIPKTKAEAKREPPYFKKKKGSK